jgi:hypothetical protein
MANRKSSAQSGNFPLDNLTYDMITIIYEKSKGLEAYDRYLKDAQGNPEIRELFEQFREQDEECVQQLQQQLASMLSEGATGGGETSRRASAGNRRS